MNLHIPLSPETEAKLREKAAAAGKDVDTFVLDVVERSLAANATEPPASTNTADDDPFLGLLAGEPELQRTTSLNLRCVPVKHGP